MSDKGQLETPDSHGCCCSSRQTGELLVTDVLERPIDLKRVTQEAKIDGRTRGQDCKKCPTDPLPLHLNLTQGVVNVSGDLKVDAESCPVRISFAQGQGGAAIFQPGTDLGITVPVAAGFAMNGKCEESKEKKICKWSFTRTSP